MAMTTVKTLCKIINVEGDIKTLKSMTIHVRYCWDNKIKYRMLYCELKMPCCELKMVF